ncbi:hypothetical protein JQS43_00520 [Natronosporangium hydrolyticum]|uniref:Lipoprotein n=1 Tax=Natronosporangium hydrolyticum TaxID=2811111 RepID=A0A895YFP6_9ACTN|nr:hypothetical protein [Natronosporangium hydrolyticum]QSB14915.1 hypothetical protein JQS43_00520 [Natronosporangium hydrolyticum]
MAQRATLLLRTVGTISAAALLAAGLTACGDDDDGLPPPPASPPPADPTDNEETLDLTPEEQEAIDEAQLVIDDFFDAYVEDARLGEPYEVAESIRVVGGRPLEFAAAELSQELQAESVENYNDGVIFEGEFSWDYLRPEGADLDRIVNDFSVPEVELSYCLDATDWTPVDRETNEPTGEPGDRRIAIISAVWYDGRGGNEEGWQVSGWEDKASGSC